MDSDSWARISSAFSRRYQSRSDVYHGEEYDAEEALRPEFLCPFCADEFDMVGLCCHIDEEHAIEAKNGVCPICAKKVGSDLVPHMTMQHGSLLNVQRRRRRLRKGGSSLSVSNLRKDFREVSLQSLLRESSFLVPSSHTEPDPLLTSFIYNPPTIDEPPSSKSQPPPEACLVAESPVEDLGQSIVQQPPLSDEDLKEKARRCEFVQGLLLSTFLDDNL